jgi:NADPH:quinone reductase-like Zn-dependent oxidoreductase
MKAAQFFAKKDIRVVDVPEPTAKEGEALIEVEWYSDSHIHYR